MSPSAPPSPRLRRALAWLVALGLVQAGATFLLGRIARDVHARGEALSAAGLLAPPQGAAADALLGWSAASGAALAYTLGIGLAAALLAHALADALARASTPVRLLPVPLGAAVALGVGGYTGMVGLWGWVAAAVLVPYALLAAPPAGRRAPGEGRRRAATWLAAGLLIAPALFVAGPEHLRAVRAALLTAPGGTALVNAYYRHALLAAEPVKSPSQRQHLVYAGQAGAGELPRWFRCAREPWPLLPASDPAQGDFRVTRADARSVDLAPLASKQTQRATASGLPLALEAVMRPADPGAFRAVVALGVAAGVPVTLAWLLAAGAVAAAGRHRGAAVAGCALAGLILAAAVLSAGEPDRAAGPGAGPLLAASDPATPLARLDALMAADPRLPVRARALAAWVARVPGTDPAQARVQAASTWYEQWHGYRALLARGWHPIAACR